MPDAPTTKPRHDLTTAEGRRLYAEALRARALALGETSSMRVWVGEDSGYVRIYVGGANYADITPDGEVRYSRGSAWTHVLKRADSALTDECSFTVDS